MKQKVALYAIVTLISILWHMSRVEWFSPQNVPKDLIDMVDFRIYYEAARGNDTWLEDNYPQYLNPRYAQGWLYPSWTRAFWFWTLPFTFNQAKWVWLFAIAISAAFIVDKLLRVKGGPLVTLLITKTYLWQVENGNVDFILAALALSPIGVLLACGVKFPAIVFLVVHAAKSKVGRKILGHAHKAA